MNALAAATVAMRYGMAPETVARILASQHTISPHRMALSTVNREGTSFTLIDDSFNANPDSMKAGLNGLKAWNSNDGKEPFRVALLGASWSSTWLATIPTLWYCSRDRTRQA